MSQAFSGPIFLNYYGDTDFDDGKFVPGRFLTAISAPHMKKKSSLRLPRTEKAQARTAADQNEAAGCRQDDV